MASGMTSRARTRLPAVNQAVTQMLTQIAAEYTALTPRLEKHRLGRELREQLQARYPEAFALVALAAVDGEHQRDFSVILQDHCEVVFMSRFSGG